MPVTFHSMAIKFYAHFLVEQPQPRGLEEFRGVVELDGQPSRAKNEAERIIARNFGRTLQDVKVLQWARLH
jgi:hypothetical protein